MNVLYGALIGAIMGAVGGLIGWGLTALIWADRDPPDRPKWLSVLCLALMFSLSRVAIHWWETPSVDQQLSEAERQVPALAALRDNDPSAYSEVHVIAQQMQDGTITQAEGIGRVRATLMAAFKRKLPTAPDELVQAQAELAAAEYASLQSVPDVCVNYIAGTEAVDLRDYLPPKMLASDQDLMARVIRAPSDPSASVASEAEVEEAVTPMLSRIAHDDAVPLSQVGEALQLKGDQQLTCRVFTTLFKGISQLPAHQAAEVTRGLMRMSNNSS